MRTLAVAEAGRLAAGWNRSPQAIREAAAAVAGVSGPVPVPDAEVGAPFQVWTHDWHAVMLRPEPGIELPATWLTARRSDRAPVILHLDDTGRHRLLHRQGLLTASIRFLDRDQPGAHLLTVDLRGWGDTAPGMYPYEMAGWGSVDRYLAYASAALGDAVMAMRIRDALASLAWLRVRCEIDPARIVLTGSGLAGLVALHVAAIAGEVAGVVAWDGLSSFRSLLAAERYPWPSDAFLPNVLRHYDLPELAGSLRCPVRLFGLRDGQGHPLDETESVRYQAVPHIIAIPEMDTARIVKSIMTLLAAGGPT